MNESNKRRTTIKRAVPNTVVPGDKAQQGEEASANNNDDDLPLAIQIFLWRQTSPFIRPKFGKLHEATCMVSSIGLILFLSTPSNHTYQTIYQNQIHSLVRAMRQFGSQHIPIFSAVVLDTLIDILCVASIE
ncbi:hypothetical protein TCAL_09732 [Tigriopus californicus]|uniref:Cation channel complex component UNC80 N-terminal domain-containing protein n=1 Tax=Tigriopus californicus TaxID=6832 RepID=A0A553NV52_TIGCA|nr:hypothetical protein TCAL_09732 [Tigriopus californicus]|eukprot:TCALIF_09732-PA protein Name:"Similar to CG18437 Protein unc-80 homolog (Drosophila melanogaster)" AED:0.20 eAED:0.20 QI:220/0.66/0.5/0.75/0.33/0.25/4/0/131